LIKHGREAHLEDVLRKFIAQYFVENKIIKAQISSPTPILASQKERLLALLKFKNASSIVLEETVDTELIGGFTLRVGDQQINASASEALSQLKREFNKNSYIADF
jgi:F-type H+-transporting ATPase subunit delta